MILIYSNQITPRFKYTFQLVFKQVLGQSIEYTNDKIVFKNAQIPKINYSSFPISDDIFFKNTTILFENNIQKQEIEVRNWKHLKAFFFHNHQKSILPFDPFAMIFFLVSRYEEYLSTDRDIHDRFQASSSLAFQHDFLEEPLVDQLAFVIRDILQSKYNHLEFMISSFSITPTYDIDYAWSYLHKGWKRTIGATMRDAIKSPKNFIQRLQVMFLNKTDPYFTFDYLNNFHQKNDLNPIYFLLVGEYGMYDKNISIKNEAFQQLILQLSDQHSIGIHPSYQSNADVKTLQQEKEQLTSLLKSKITRSRQHFLKLKFPDTYQNLIDIGIQSEYSMGYAERVGFRASIARPFFWFDLTTNRTTDLQVFPFQVMDVTLKNYMKLSPSLAILKTKEILEKVEAVQGHFISIWHNNSLCEQDGWEGWRTVLEASFEE